jgi:hypothetical protein
LGTSKYPRDKKNDFLPNERKYSMSPIGIRHLVLSALLTTCISAMATDGADYRARYARPDAKSKLVDNHGNGFEPLYGTRNVRAVLSGIYYRGGANNAYNRSHKRANQNPLPNEGLQNLCEEGFSTALYLYSTHFSTAPHTVNCKMNDGSSNQLVYKQVSILSASNTQIHDVLALILSSLRDPNKGPIYAHCWNGWHASGMTAAFTLKQFCGFSAAQAVAYWNVNTDGNDGSAYNGIRNKIKAFVPFPDLSLTAEEKAAVCPDGSSLKFR